MLEQYFAELGAGGASGTIVFRADQGVDDPAVIAGMEELFATVNAGFPDENGDPQHPGATVVSPYSEQGASQIARQGPLAGQLAYAQVNLAADVDLTESAALGEAISDHAPAIDGLEVLPGGTALAVFEPPETEFIGLAFAIVVLILAFGSVLAMGLPLAVALGGVGAGHGPDRHPQQRLQHPRLHHLPRDHDRARRRHRLRPVHRHPLPGGDPRRPLAPRRRPSRRWTPPAGP